MSRQNGAEPDRLALIVEELQAELAAEDAAVGQAEAALAEARGRRAKIQRAIDVLDGTPKAKRAPKTKGWIIGEEKVSQVQSFMEVRSEPITISGVAEELGISRESVRRSLKVLRDRDLIRVSGKQPGRGGGQDLFMPMPELTDAG
jgi:response regulator of citrate/malate metabolism